MKQVDARGLSCPQPVLYAKKGILDNPSAIEIIVDNNTAAGNVERFLKNSGYEVKINEKGEDFILTGRK